MFFDLSRELQTWRLRLLQVLTILSGLSLLIAVLIHAFDQDAKEINSPEEPNGHTTVSLAIDSPEPLPELETAEILY